MSQGPLPTAAGRYPYTPSLIPSPLRDARPGVSGTPGHYPGWFLRSLCILALDGCSQAAPHDREELFRLGLTESAEEHTRLTPGGKALLARDAPNALGSPVLLKGGHDGVILAKMAERARVEVQSWAEVVGLDRATPVDLWWCAETRVDGKPILAAACATRDLAIETVRAMAAVAKSQPALATDPLPERLLTYLRDVVGGAWRHVPGADMMELEVRGLVEVKRGRSLVFEGVVFDVVLTPAGRVALGAVGEQKPEDPLAPHLADALWVIAGNGKVSAADEEALVSTGHVRREHVGLVGGGRMVVRLTDKGRAALVARPAVAPPGKADDGLAAREECTFCDGTKGWTTQDRFPPKRVTVVRVLPHGPHTMYGFATRLAAIQEMNRRIERKEEDRRAVTPGKVERPFWEWLGAIKRLSTLATGSVCSAVTGETFGPLLHRGWVVSVGGEMLITEAGDAALAQLPAEPMPPPAGVLAQPDAAEKLHARPVPEGPAVDTRMGCVERAAQAPRGVEQAVRSMLGATTEETTLDAANRVAAERDRAVGEAAAWKGLHANLAAREDEVCRALGASLDEGVVAAAARVAQERSALKAKSEALTGRDAFVRGVLRAGEQEDTVSAANRVVAEHAEVILSLTVSEDLFLRVRRALGLKEGDGVSLLDHAKFLAAERSPDYRAHDAEIRAALGARAEESTLAAAFRVAGRTAPAPKPTTLQALAALVRNVLPNTAPIAWRLSGADATAGDLATGIEAGLPTALVVGDQIVKATCEVLIEGKLVAADLPNLHAVLGAKGGETTLAAAERMASDLRDARAAIAKAGPPVDFADEIAAHLTARCAESEGMPWSHVTHRVELEGQIRAGRVEITGATMRSGGFPSITDSVKATEPTLDDIDRTVREVVEKHNSGEKPVVTIAGKRPVLRHLGGTRVEIEGPDGKDNAVLVITSTGVQAVFS